MTAPATLDHLRQYVIAAARRIGRGFTSPSDDWMQVAFVQSPEGLDVIGLANDMFASGLSKDVLGEFLRRYVVEKGAYRYVVLLNMHVAKQPTSEQLEAVRAETLRVEQIEGASEMLALLAGDAEEEQFWWAPIERRPGTAIRAMGRWERLDEQAGDSFEGRFAGLNAYMRQPRPAEDA